MATQVNLAPFINEEFCVTGAWGEVRPSGVHAGIDLQTRKAYETDIGQPVYAMEDGIVTRVDQTDQGTGYGALIIIWNQVTNNLWLYGDLSDNTILVNVNDRVVKGQHISYEGNPSGTTSTGLHVHLEKENQSDGEFKFGYINSIDPTTGTGIPNVVSSDEYIYYGTIPPTEKKKRFPWAIFTKKIRQKRRGIL